MPVHSTVSGKVRIPVQENMASKKAYPLRVEKEIWEAIRCWSNDELRSVNAQIEYVLREALRKAGRLPKPREDDS